MLTTEQCSAVILAGGKSRRMGVPKALLTLQGETFLARMTGQLAEFDDLLLSANDPRITAGFPGRVVSDVYNDAGPLAGLHAALSAAKHPHALCIACDVVNFTAELADAMLTAWTADMDALVCVEADGGICPTCAIYSKTALRAMETQLRAGSYRLRELLAQLRCGWFAVENCIPGGFLQNINTKEDYNSLI